MAESPFRVILLTLAIKWTLESLSKGNHSLGVITCESALLGEKALKEKNIILKATDLKARRCCEIIWSGLSITVPSAASTPTTWCKYLVCTIPCSASSPFPVTAYSPPSLLCVCRKKIKILVYL